MKDPKRLIDSDAGLARNVLRSASQQAAPEPALQNVLHIVDLALAQKAAASREAASNAAAFSPRSSQSSRGPIGKHGSKSRAPVRAWLRFGLALEVSTLLPMGVAMAAGIGGTVIVTRVIEHVQSSPPESLESRPGADQRAPRMPRRAAPRASGEVAPPPLNATPLVNSSGSSPGTADSISYRAPSSRQSVEQLAWAKTAMPASLPPATEAVEDDWLGEQFTMVANARRILDAGNPAEALEILEDYARRFPEGTLGPQVADLRLRASQTGATLGLLEEFDFGI